MSRLFRDLKVGGLYRLLCYPYATSGEGRLGVRLTPGNLFLVLETRPVPRNEAVRAEILMGSKIFKICLGPNDFEPVEEA